MIQYQSILFLIRRECYTVNVLYCRSGEDRLEDLISGRESGSKEFQSFIWNLGWPVDLQNHVGYKGSLSNQAYSVIPYYANLTSEFVFKCPILMKKEIYCRPVSFQPIRKKSAGPGSVDDLDIFNSAPLTFRQQRLRSHSVGLPKVGEQMEIEQENGVECEVFAIIWLEELNSFNKLVTSLPSSISISIIVHPLNYSPGLFWIRFFGKLDVHEEILVSLY